MSELESNMPFITFEGIDGAGKSTLIHSLHRHLSSLGHKVLLTREPGGTVLGEEFRKILLRTTGEAPSPLCELLIYEADRAHHVETVIRPNLEKWVLSDRYADSSLVFQGYGRGLDTSMIEQLNEIATQGLWPEVTFLVDCPVEVAFGRMKNRTADRFERQEREFHERIRSGFLAHAKKNSNRFVVLDSTLNPEISVQRMIAELGKRGLL